MVLTQRFSRACLGGKVYIFRELWICLEFKIISNQLITPDLELVGNVNPIILFIKVMLLKVNLFTSDNADWTAYYSQQLSLLHWYYLKSDFIQDN